MRINFNRLIRIVAVFAFCTLMVSSIFGVGAPQDISTSLGSATTAQSITKTATNIWATAASVIQILAVAAIVIAGLRYMFASADAKADIKKQTVILIIGAVLVFGATAILKMINSASTVISA